MTINGKKYFTFLNYITSKGIGLHNSFQGQVIMKAGWNYIMLEHDGSNGAHAPNLSLEIIKTSIDKLKETDFTTITPL